MSDLMNLSQFKKTSTEGSESDSNQPGNVPPMRSNAVERGDNIINKAGKKVDSAATEETNVEADKETTKKEESSVVSNPDSWTKESALKEMKKAREEAKATRLKYEESVQKLKEEAEARIAAVKQEQDELRKSADELARVKADQEDKKRDLAEKVAHREALIAQLKAEGDAKTRAVQEQFEQQRAELERYRAEAQAQSKVYEERLAQELAKIPEKYKTSANYLVKGAGDARDALLALQEASLNGLFEDKTVVVNHSVPGAKEGARSSKEKLDIAAEEERKKLSSMQKIGVGLKSWRNGTPNSAIRSR